MQGRQEVMVPLNRQRIIALCIVVITISGYFLYTQWINPAPFYTAEYDPEMQYFENSLALFKGTSYAYIDHPGTPVEVIGTLILALTRPISRDLDVFFIPYHLAHPELFLTLAHGFLTIISILVIIVLAKIGKQRLKNSDLLSSLGVAVLYFALLPPLTFQALHWWTHNAFNFPFGTLLFAILIYRIRGNDPLSKLEVLFLSILAGILSAVQIYLVAWSIGIFISITVYTHLLRRSWQSTLKTSLLSFLGIALGFSIAFAPVMHRFRRFYIWMKDLVFHQGRYGHGAAGFSTPGQMIDNLGSLWNMGQVVLLVTFLAMMLLLLGMWIRRRKVSLFTSWWAIAIGIFYQLVILILLIAKHPGQNYLLSIAAALPIQFLLIFEVLLEQGGWWERISRALGMLSIIGFLLGALISFTDHRKLVNQVARADSEIEAAINSYMDETEKSRDELVILWGYGVPSRCFALRYGNTSTEGAALTEEIDEICPGQWLYDVFGGFVELPTVYEPLSENRDWDIVILPERFLPSESTNLGRVVISDAQTQGYGNLVFLFALEAGD